MKHGSREHSRIPPGQHPTTDQERLEGVVRALGYKDSWFRETKEVVKRTVEPKTANAIRKMPGDSLKGRVQAWLLQ